MHLTTTRRFFLTFIYRLTGSEQPCNIQFPLSHIEGKYFFKTYCYLQSVVVFSAHCRYAQVRRSLRCLQESQSNSSRCLKHRFGNYQRRN